ncbi:MAG: hypothetical protein ABIE84_04005, partial [bacterium]
EVESILARRADTSEGSEYSKRTSLAFMAIGKRIGSHSLLAGQNKMTVTETAASMFPFLVEATIANDIMVQGAFIAGVFSALFESTEIDPTRGAETDSGAKGAIISSMLSKLQPIRGNRSVVLWATVDCLYPGQQKVQAAVHDLVIRL